MIEILLSIFALVLGGFLMLVFTFCALICILCFFGRILQLMGF